MLASTEQPSYPQCVLPLHQRLANHSPQAKSDLLSAVEIVFLERSHTHSFMYSSLPFALVSLSIVVVTHDLLKCENNKCKISKINNSYVLNCMPF